MMEVIILILLIAIFLWQSYLIMRKRKYSFISNLRVRTDEEIKQLEKSGYIRAMGRLYVSSALILCVGLLLVYMSIPFAFIVTLLLFILFLAGGHIYIQKYEQKERKKRAYWTNGIAALLTIVIVVLVLGFGFRTNDLIVGEEYIEITGPYGETVQTDDIQEINLLNDLPKVESKTNGFASGSRLVGNFLLERYGKGKLYIHDDQSPYLFIEFEDRYMIINSKDSDETEEWYRLLENVVQ